MNKAKALFAIGMVAVVAGSSATAWYLNEKGIIGESASEEYVEEFFDEDIDDNNKNDKNNKNDSLKDNKDKDETTTQSEKMSETAKDSETEKNEQKPADETTKADKDKPVADEKVDNDKINDFLTNFAAVSFAEQGGAFTGKSFSGYELVRFAYSHIMRTEKSAVKTIEKDDYVKYYNVVSYKKVNEVLGRFFDVSVSPENVKSQYSEAFFDYEDGKFITPATDGMAYINYVVADSVRKDDNTYYVQFTVFSGDAAYADGEAKIIEENGGMKLAYYKIYA